MDLNVQIHSLGVLPHTPRRKRKSGAAGVYPVAPDYVFLEMIML